MFRYPIYFIKTHNAICRKSAIGLRSDFVPVEAGFTRAGSLEADRHIRRGGRGWEVGRGRLRRPGWRRNACTGAGRGRLPRLSHTIPPPVKPPPPIQARLPFPSNNLPLRASSSLPHQWADIHDGVKAPAYLSHPRVSRVLPSFSPLHRKNDQKSYRGAKLTTEQTIASTSPVHVKRSSPIAKKISRKIGHIFPKIHRISISIARCLLLKERTFYRCYK